MLSWRPWRISVVMVTLGILCCHGYPGESVLSRIAQMFSGYIAMVGSGFPHSDIVVGELHFEIIPRQNERIVTFNGGVFQRICRVLVCVEQPL